MRFFEKFFGSDVHISNSTGEWHVRCPFPHKNSDGSTYMESNSSAHVNPDKSTFHCKVPNCKSKDFGTAKGGLSETSFMAALQNLSYAEAIQIIKTMEGYEEETDSWSTWENNFQSTPIKDKLLGMVGLDAEEDAELIESLRLGYRGRGLVFPTFIYGEYMGSCDYTSEPEEGQRKALLEKGMGQAIYPFDLWREDERDTYLCAGFKDATIARKNGLNAISFSHGEGSFPKLYKRMFTGKKIFICYDNDEGGADGAARTATLLKEVGAYPYIVDLSLVCAEKGQDIHDFFTIYGKTSEDLKEMAEATPLFSEEMYEKERNKIFPLVSLEESTSGKAVGQILSSRVAVVANFTDKTYRVPDVIEFEMMNKNGGDVMAYGDRIVWTLGEDNIEDILYLMDNGLKEAEIAKNMKMLVGLPAKEPVTIRKLSQIAIHKAVVVDDVENDIIEDLDGAYSPIEMLMYSKGDDGRMKNGEKYRIFYKTVTNPYGAQELVGVVSHIETSDTSINKYKVTDEVLESLKVFQVQEGETVKQKMTELFERSKAILGPESNAEVFYTTELFYHTPLDFMFGDDRKERAYLEPMIIGESRTHKSATAKGLLNMYELGAFVSLKNASVAGLIGGSQGSSSGGFKTRLGVIPRNHKGAIVLEEFSGAPADFIKKMTDIRSSNMVKLERVSGTTTAPAKVRMLTLSNVRHRPGEMPMPISHYPSGVAVVMELVGAAEDINRYDFFIMKGAGETIAPNTKVNVEAYPKEAYMNRIRWIWSRKAEEVYLDEVVRDYIIKCADDLNKNYACHIQFLGREAWKKLSRVSIAVAACVCSFDETGTKLKVTEAHVVWAKNFLDACYRSELFQLARHVKEERDFDMCDAADVQALQGIYNRDPALITQMDRGVDYTLFQLKAIAGGGEKDDFNKIMNRLTEGHFILQGERIRPSGKFRKAIKKIQTNTRMKRV